MEVPRHARLALFALILFLALSNIQPSLAIDAEEIQALQTIIAHYPLLNDTWGPITTAICVTKFLSGFGCHPEGHVKSLSFLLGPSAQNPTGPLGNISGLHSLTSLALPSWANIPSHDDWYRQLPSLTRLAISARETLPLVETCTMDFSNNPNLESLTIIDLTNGPQFTHKLIASSSLKVVELTTTRASTFAPDFFSQVRSIGQLTLSATQGYDFPTYTHLSLLYTLTISAPEMESLPSNIGDLASLLTLVCTNCSSLTKLPASFSSLTQLVSLHSPGSKLNLPDSIPDMSGTTLWSINLESNGLVTVPAMFCTLRTPTPQTGYYFFLANNPLTSLPSCWAGNTHIKRLRLDNAKLTTFPAIASWSNLEELIMPNIPTLGRAGASIPSFDTLNNIRIIDMTNCGLSGTFPAAALSASSSLSIIRMSGNRFTGTLPANFFQASSLSLKEFAIAGNSLSGTFPRLYSRCKLTHFLIGGNKFSPYEPSIKNCTSLVNIDVSGNEWPTLPQPADFVASFLSLTALNISFNPSLTSVDSSLPPIFSGSWSRLASFNASGCGYTGPLPTTHHHYMTSLDLSHNALNGTLDGFVTSSLQFEVLDLSHNRLTGGFFSTKDTFPASVSLDVSYNQLEGPIWNKFTMWDSIRSLKASHNNLTGTMPLFPASIETLWLDGNSIDLCPQNPDSQLSFLQSCRMDGEKQFVTDCACSDFYFHRRCTLTTDCTPPPMDPPPTEPITPIDPGTPPTGAPHTGAPHGSSLSAPGIIPTPAMIAALMMAALMFL